MDGALAGVALVLLIDASPNFRIWRKSRDKSSKEVRPEVIGGNGLDHRRVEATASHKKLEGIEGVADLFRVNTLNDLLVGNMSKIPTEALSGYLGPIES